MGMIYKRGRVWWIKYHMDGKPFRESSGSEKVTDAKRLLKRREGEISIGKAPGVYFDRVRFDDLAADYLSDYRVNGKKSIRRADLNVKHLKAAFAGFRVTAISTPKIQEYIEHRQQEGAANGSINRELTALKRMFNLGARQVPPKIDRVPYVPMLRENNVRTGFFEHSEFLALREALPVHLKGFITFAYKVGWRLTEVSTLQWNQVDLEQGIVRLEPGETKNSEGRTIYLDEELKQVFRAQREARKEANNLLPWVFLNETGTDRVKRFDKSWRTACRKAKIGVKLFHDFRRTAVRNMVRAGIPERVSMMVSGHKTRSIFDRYDIVSDTDLKLAAKRQEEYLQSQIGTITGTIEPLKTRKSL